MICLWEAPAAVAALLAWLLAPAQTIGQVAEREEFRRQIVGQSTGVYTNVGLSPAPVRSAVEGLTARPAGAGDDGVTAAPRAEAWWRNRITTARAALDRDQLLADGFSSRVNALTREIVNQTDAAQQARLRSQLQKAMDELDKLQKIVLTDRRELEAIQEDARRQAIPAAWLR